MFCNFATDFLKRLFHLPFSMLIMIQCPKIRYRDACWKLVEDISHTNPWLNLITLIKPYPLRKTLPNVRQYGPKSTTDLIEQRCAIYSGAQKKIKMTPFMK